jgi:Uma2 family endonuclease
MLDLIFEEKKSQEKMPSLNHSYLCTQIIKQLLQHPELLPLTELTLDIDNGLTPDICVYPVKQIHPNFFNDVTRYSELPILAIEIISSSQNIQTILQKAQKLVNCGIKTVLSLEPYTRTVFITQKDQENSLVYNSSVDIDGICIDFKKIFE